MNGGNGSELDTQETMTDGDHGKKTANELVEEGSFSGTDVDSAVLLALNQLRGSLTAADRPRPATGIDRGNNVGSHSYHFVGSKKPALYADVGYVRPHHSHANVNISTQAVNDDDHVTKGDLSTVESSKSDSELLIVQDMEELPDDSVTRLSRFLAKAVTLASANEVVRQSNSSDPLFVSHLNKCNSSSKTYEADLVDPGQSPGVRGQMSAECITTHRSAVGIKGERGVGTTEGKRSSHSMLGRIKILTKCLSSSDEGRSREDMTASSEDASTRRRVISKIPKKKKTKKRKKQSSGEEVEKSNSEEKTSSETEVGKAIPGTGADKAAFGMEVGKATYGTEVGKATYGTEGAGATSATKVDNVATGMEVDMAAIGTGEDQAVVGMEVAKEGITGHGISKGGLLDLPPPDDVLKEMKVNSNEEASAVVSPIADQLSTGCRDTRPDLGSKSIADERQQYDTEANLASDFAARHSGSSIELLCEYGEHIDGGEPVLSAIVTPGGQTSPTITKLPTRPVETQIPPKHKILGEDDTKQVCVIHHTSAPVTLNQTEEDDSNSQPEITLRAVKERHRVLSEQISDATPGSLIDDKLRLADLGSFSFAAESSDHPELMGRRAASAPGPLEHMAQHLAEEYAKDHQTESGISSFDGTYYDESSNHHHGTPEGKHDSGSGISAGISHSQIQDQTAQLMTSSDSSQDDYVQQMRKAQRSIDAHQTASPTPQQPHPGSATTDKANKPKDGGDLMDTMQDPDFKLVMNDYGKSLRNIGSSITSGYGSSLHAKIAELETNLSISEGLGKPYKVETLVEEDSVRKKELGYILQMLQKDGDGQGEDSHRDPGLLEAAVSYLYWSRHDVQDLLRKPQQHQKVVMEDKLEAQNLQLDLPPHSSFRGNDMLEQLKSELELKVKQIEDAISQNQGSRVVTGQGIQDPLPHTQEGATERTVAPQEISGDILEHPPVSLISPDAEAKYSSGSSSSEDSRLPSSFHCNQSVAIMSPGGALGSGNLPEECQSARRVRRETEERIAKLEKEKEDMTSQMKAQCLTSVQLEAHLLSQLTTLAKEYQNLKAHNQEHKQLSEDWKLQLDKKQKELEEAKAHVVPGGTDPQQLQNQLDTLSFTSKEKIHQLSVRLAAAEETNRQLENGLRQEVARQETLRGKSGRREEEAGRERDALMEELRRERSKCSQLDAELASQSDDLHQMATSIQELEREGHTKAGEMRRLHRALETSRQDRAELEQQLRRANQRLDAKHEQWKKQTQELSGHLSVARASLEKSQLHLKTLTHTNQTLTGTTVQLRERYQGLNSQLHKERLAKEMTSHDLEKVRGALEGERKSRSELVNSQLSQWQQNLQSSTLKLSEALKNKICKQQQEIQQLRASSTELAADHNCDARHSVPSTSGAHVCSQCQNEASISSGHHNQYKLCHQPQATCCAHSKDWTNFDTGGGVCSGTRQGCVGRRQPAQAVLNA